MDAPTRILTTMNHEEPDRVPAFESTFSNNTIMRHYGFKTYPIGGLLKVLNFTPFRHSILRSTFQNRKALTIGMETLIKFYRTVKLDLIPSICSLFPRKLIKGGFVDEYGRIMKPEIYPTDGTEILGYHGGYFKTFEDYENWEQPDANDKERLAGFLAGRDLQKKYNNEVFVIPSTGALMECTWEGFGIERFSRLLAHKKEIEKIFDDRGKFTLELVKILAENDAKLILLFDDYGFKKGSFMPPRMYQKLVFPRLKQICETAHKMGSKIMLHSCGDIYDLFEDIIGCGIDAINPIEPTTANPEYDIFKLHAKYGDKLTFVGNISPQMLSTGEISEIQDYSKRLINELAPGGGFIFASGHSINPATTLDRWLAVMEIREKYGNYPIKIS
jgi:hypothetical protein